MNAQGDSGRVLVGIIDSGLGADDQRCMPVIAARRFAGGSDGLTRIAPVEADVIGHGSKIAEILLENNPCVDLLIAQVFVSQRKCSTIQVVAALDWLVGCGAAVINLSFGVRRPDAQLRLACEGAVAAGSILVSSAPARGGPVFPASYPFCIAVSGDARCTRDQFSWLGSAGADYGAYAFASPGISQSGGASFAAARISARIARELSRGMAVSDIHICLRAQSSYHGLEHKRADTVQRATATDTSELQP